MSIAQLSQSFYLFLPVSEGWDFRERRVFKLHSFFSLLPSSLAHLSGLSRNPAKTLENLLLYATTFSVVRKASSDAILSHSCFKPSSSLFCTFLPTLDPEEEACRCLRLDLLFSFPLLCTSSAKSPKGRVHRLSRFFVHRSSIFPSSCRILLQPQELRLSRVSAAILLPSEGKVGEREQTWTSAAFF